MTTFSESTRSYNCWAQCRHQPWAYYVAILMLLFGYLCNLMALPLNRLTTVSVSGSSNFDSYCGWDSLDHQANIPNEDRQPSDGSYYEYCVHFDVFCENKNEGRVWLGLGLSSILIGLLSWIAMFRELCKNSKCLILTTTILFSVISIVN
eukprot:280573_1